MTDIADFKTLYKVYWFSYLIYLEKQQEAIDSIDAVVEWTECDEWDSVTLELNMIYLCKNWLEI